MLQDREFSDRPGVPRRGTVAAVGVPGAARLTRTSIVVMVVAGLSPRASSGYSSAGTSPPPSASSPTFLQHPRAAGAAGARRPASGLLLPPSALGVAAGRARGGSPAASSSGRSGSQGLLGLAGASPGKQSVAGLEGLLDDHLRADAGGAEGGGEAATAAGSAGQGGQQQQQPALAGAGGSGGGGSVTLRTLQVRWRAGAAALLARWLCACSASDLCAGCALRACLPACLPSSTRTHTHTRDPAAWRRACPAGA